MSLLYDMLINDNTNIVIIMKIKLKNIYKFWRHKVLEQTKFTLVLIAEFSCAISSDAFLRDLIRPVDLLAK